MIKDIAEAKKICQDFANKHKLIFDDSGECGFGRDCVGLSTGKGWLDFNPHKHLPPPGFYEEISELKNDKLYPPDDVPDAYHKHDCLCVLVLDSDHRDDAIIQLATWIRHIEAQGPIHIVEYPTGYTPADGMAALIHGLISLALYVGDQPPKLI